MLLGLPLVAAVVLVTGRVGATARFVTWPIVVFTVLAATVALVGVWVGLDRPGLLAGGVLPGLMVAYVLPAAPVTVVAGVLVGLAALAVGARGIAAGTAMTVAATMVLAGGTPTVRVADASAMTFGAMTGSRYGALRSERGLSVAQTV